MIPGLTTFDPDAPCTYTSATALYPTLALLNHSCRPNTAKFASDGTRITVVAVRAIEEGEEVTENYYPAFQCMGREARRDWLREHYKYSRFVLIHIDPTYLVRCLKNTLKESAVACLLNKQNRK